MERQRHRILRQGGRQDRNAFAFRRRHHVGRYGAGVADDDDVDAHECAYGNRVEMVLYRDQDRLVARMPHHV